MGWEEKHRTFFYHSIYPQCILSDVLVLQKATLTDWLTDWLTVLVKGKEAVGNTKTLFVTKLQGPKASIVTRVYLRGKSPSVFKRKKLSRTCQAWDVCCVPHQPPSCTPSPPLTSHHLPSLTPSSLSFLHASICLFIYFFLLSLSPSSRFHLHRRHH